LREVGNDSFYRVVNGSYMYLFMAYRGANKGIEKAHGIGGGG